MSCASHDSNQCSTPDSGATSASAIARPCHGWWFLSASTISADSTPTPMKATTRSTPNRNVAVSLPFHGRITFISAATTWYQLRPSALMMPSVKGFTAPPGVSAMLSARPRTSNVSLPAPVADSRACSAISSA
jgi:hypothetical protein